MVPCEQSPTTDGHSLRLPRRSSRRLLDRGVSRVNKRSTLGLLAVAVGVAAATTRDGLVVAVPLLVAGWYLLGRPLARTDPPR